MTSDRPPYAFTELELSDEEIEQLLDVPVAPPADDILSALARLAWREDAAPSIERRVAPTLAAVGAGRARAYRPSETAVVLGAFAATLLAFDSEGLMTWVQRMDVSPAQAAWRSVLGPMNARLDHAGLTAPRRWAIGAGDRLSLALGSSEDPVLAEGWKAPAAAPVLVPLPAAVTEPPEAPAATLPSPEPPRSGGADRARVTVLLVGDSMIAGSLGNTVSRALARDSRLHVVGAFQTATGLARPDIYDWGNVLPPLLEREQPALIVCSLGANDATNIREGDRQLEFGEPGWRVAYSARVMAMMGAFSRTGANVLWLGLPPMREARYSAHAAYLNAIFAQAARKTPHVEFLELRMLVSDRASGEYSTFVPGPGGRLIRFRLDDGIHYAPAGASAITRWVVDWIYERYRKLPPR